MTPGEVIAIVEDETMSVLNQICAEDRRTMPAHLLDDVRSEVRAIVSPVAETLCSVPEDTMRGILRRNIKKAVADLRPS